VIVPVVVGVRVRVRVPVVVGVLVRVTVPVVVRVRVAVPIVMRVSVCVVRVDAVTVSSDRSIGLDMNVLTVNFTFHGDTRLARTAARSTHHDTSNSVTRSSSPPVINN
jgi:hypothetical protein